MIVSQNTAHMLPTGWSECSIGQVTLPVSKTNLKDDPDREIDYIDISSIDNNRHVIGRVKQYRLGDAPSRARQIVRAGDVLFATVRPYLRNIAAVPNDYDQQIASTGFSVLRPAEGVCPAFLFYKAISRDHVNALSGMQYGVSYPAVKDEQVRDQPLWLPPTEEQARIVARLEELFSELDQGVESLKTARVQLNVYRQAVLKHAFEGKLTAQWREENKDKLEKPEQLLARIKQERAARYEHQLKEWKAAVKIWEEGGNPGKRPARPPKLEEISHLSLTEIEPLPSIPAGWSYLRLGLVIDEPKYGSSKKCDYDYKGTGGLRIPNVVRGVVDASDLKGTHFKEDEKRTYSLRRGDILVIRSNGSISIVGRCALISKMEEQYLYAGYLIRLRSNLATLLPEYFAALLSSHLLRTQIEHKSKSTSGVNNINSGEIQSLIVPLCSLSEQNVVVERLSTSLSAIDVIEAEIDSQLLKADVLRQSVLREAFAGHLVPQDPRDEPASVLLDRIRAEREQTMKNKTTKKTKKRKAAA